MMTVRCSHLKLSTSLATCPAQCATLQSGRLTWAQFVRRLSSTASRRPASPGGRNAAASRAERPRARTSWRVEPGGGAGPAASYLLWYRLSCPERGLWNQR